MFTIPNQAVLLSNRVIIAIAFKWSHNIKVVKGRVPDDAKWIQDGVFFVAKPYVNLHIGHFVESVNQVLLKLRYPVIYPPFTDLYLPFFENTEFEWSKTYLQLLLSLFPNELKPSLHLANSIPLNHLTCFRSAVFS